MNSSIQNSNSDDINSSVKPAVTPDLMGSKTDISLKDLENISLKDYFSKINLSQKKGNIPFISRLLYDSLDNGFDVFISTYQNLNISTFSLKEKKLLDTKISPIFIADKISQLICKSQTLTKAQFDFLNKTNLLSVTDLLSIQKRAEIKEGSILLKRLIEPHLAKNNRTQEIYKIWKEIECCIAAKTLIDIAAIKSSAINISQAKIEREKVPISKDYNYYAYKANKMSNLRTVDQKNYDKVLDSFIQFLTNNITPQLSEILEALNFNINHFLKKIRVYPKKNLLSILENLFENVSLESIYKNLSQEEKEKFLLNINLIINKIPKYEEIKKINNSYFNNAPITLSPYGKTIADGKELIECLLNMKDKNFSLDLMISIFDIFTPELKKLWNSNLSGFSVVLYTIPSKIKDLSKKNINNIQLLIIEFEKYTLEKELKNKISSSKNFTNTPSKNKNNFKI